MCAQESLMTRALGLEPTPRLGTIVAGLSLVLAASGTMVQARLNADLVATTRNPLQVSLINLVVAASAAAFIIFMVPGLRASLRVTVMAIRTGLLRPWMLLGGLLGGYYIAIQGSAAQAVGVAVFTVAVVAGQTAAALVVDKLGISPLGRKSITVQRVLAALLAVGAVLVVAAGRLSERETGSVELILVVVLSASAGVASALQQAVNGHVAAVSNRGVTAAWINFVGGAIVMAIVVTIVAWGTRIDVTPIPASSWYLLGGGLFGLVYIATVSWVVRLVGVLSASLLTLVGLLGGSVLLDALVPTVGSTVNWQLILGVALTGLAVLLVSRSSRT